MPVCLRSGQGGVGVRSLWARQMGRRVTEAEPDALAQAHGEVRDGGHVPGAQRDVGAHDYLVGPANRANTVASVQMGDPGDGHAVIEAQDQFQRTGHRAAASLDDADHMRRIDGHEVDQRDRAAGGLEQRFQHQAVAAILARDARGDPGRSDAPQPVLPGSQK